MDDNPFASDHILQKAKNCILSICKAEKIAYEEIQRKHAEIWSNLSQILEHSRSDVVDDWSSVEKKNIEERDVLDTLFAIDFEIPSTCLPEAKPVFFGPSMGPFTEKKTRSSDTPAPPSWNDSLPQKSQKSNTNIASEPSVQAEEPSTKPKKDKKTKVDKKTVKSEKTEKLDKKDKKEKKKNSPTASDGAPESPAESIKNPKIKKPSKPKLAKSTEESDSQMSATEGEISVSHTESLSLKDTESTEEHTSVLEETSASQQEEKSTETAGKESTTNSDSIVQSGSSRLNTSITTTQYDIPEESEELTDSSGSSIPPPPDDDYESDYAYRTESEHHGNEQKSDLSDVLTNPDGTSSIENTPRPTSSLESASDIEESEKGSEYDDYLPEYDGDENIDEDSEVSE